MTRLTDVGAGRVLLLGDLRTQADTVGRDCWSSGSRVHYCCPSGFKSKAMGCFHRGMFLTAIPDGLSWEYGLKFLTSSSERWKI